jgi:hypothetical protein
MNSAIYRTKLSTGLFSRIARDLNLSRHHVCEVANGRRRSPRVEAALKAEFSRIEKLVLKFERGTKTKTGSVAA